MITAASVRPGQSENLLGYLSSVILDMHDRLVTAIEEYRYYRSEM